MNLNDLLQILSNTVKARTEVEENQHGGIEKNHYR